MKRPPRRAAVEEMDCVDVGSAVPAELCRIDLNRMAKGYLVAVPWPNFVVGETTYDFSHLNEYTFVAADSDGNNRRIVVSYEDHCFTRKPTGTNDPAPVFPNCSRNDGRFCTERFELSKEIRARLDEALKGKVWNSTSDHYAVIVIDMGEEKIEYGIVFSLDKVKGIAGVDLHMRIRTAHPRTDEPLGTFGHIRFAHLIKLRMQNQRPTKLFGKHRKKPQK